MLVTITRLTDGGDIIGYVDQAATSDYVVIHDPMDLVGTRTLNGPGLALQPATILGSDKTVAINKANVVYTYNASTLMIQYYHKMVEYSERFLQTNYREMISEAIQDVEMKLHQTQDVEVASTKPTVH